MRYPPAGTRAHFMGGRGGVVRLPPLKLHNLTATLSIVHKTCKNSGLQLLKISASETYWLSVYKSDDFWTHLCKTGRLCRQARAIYSTSRLASQAPCGLVTGSLYQLRYIVAPGVKIT